jgi:hypothetical protein
MTTARSPEEAICTLVAVREKLSSASIPKIARSCGLDALTVKKIAVGLTKRTSVVRKLSSWPKFRSAIARLKAASRVRRICSSSAGAALIADADLASARSTTAVLNKSLRIPLVVATDASNGV